LLIKKNFTDHNKKCAFYLRNQTANTRGYQSQSATLYLTVRITMFSHHKFSHIWKDWDLFISSTSFSILRRIGWDIDPISPATKDFIAVKTPTVLFSSLLIYILIIGIGYAHIKRTRNNLLNNKDPTYLRFFVVLHNIFLILLSLYMCFGCIFEAIKNKYYIWGNQYREEELKLAKYIYIFYVSKIYEFVDTFIMLLKGNIKQISFLHVYHHSTISFIWWMITRKAPGGDAYFSAALNSWVHVCMYTYYLSATLIGKNKLIRDKYLWWGKYLTQLQILQFVLNLLQALYCSAFSPYPKWISKLLFFYMLSLLLLFGHFYYIKHIALKSNKKRS
jgi:elongation of very long chain fatty acids protein 4